MGGHRVSIVIALAVSLACGGQLDDHMMDAAVDVSGDQQSDAASDGFAHQDAPIVEDAGPLPDGSVRCGPATWCDPTTQYCQLIGVAPPGNGECLPMPANCLGDVSCACLMEAGAPMCNCTAQDSGILLSDCIEP